MARKTNSVSQARKAVRANGKPVRRARAPGTKPRPTGRARNVPAYRRVNRKVREQQALKLHPRIGMLARAVVDPFSAAAASVLVKSLYDPTGMSRSIPRVRRVIVSVNLPTTTVSGVDIFIPLSCTIPPFVQYGYNWTTTPVYSFAGGDATQEFEEGSTMRVVYGGVKIGYDGAMQTRGGRFYHFVPHGAAVDTDYSAEALSVPNAVGSTAAALRQAISSEEVPRSGDITFIMPPRVRWSDVHSMTAPAPPTGGTFSHADGVRLYYVGTGGPYTFEIVTGVEYYHTSAHSLASPTHNHIGGIVVHQTMNNMLTMPNSDASSVRAQGGVHKMLGHVESAIQAAGGVVVAARAAGDVAKAAYGLGKSWGLFGEVAGAAAEALPMLAL